MRWIILRAPGTLPGAKKPDEFVISDNAVVLTVSEHSILENLGNTPVDVAELTVPVSPQVVLLISPSCHDGMVAEISSATVRRINTRAVQWAYDQVFGSSLWQDFQPFVDRNIGKFALWFPEQKPHWFNRSDP